MADFNVNIATEAELVDFLATIRAVHVDDLALKADISTVQTHTDNDDIHRELNDAVTSLTSLWSSQKTQNELDGLAFGLGELTDVTLTTPAARHVIAYDATAEEFVNRLLTEADISDLGPYLSNVADDTSPQLGGNLDAANNNISNVDSLNVNNSSVIASNESSHVRMGFGSHDASYILTLRGSGAAAQEALLADGDINVLGAIIVTGTVDGVDISVFKTDFDTHIGNDDIHRELNDAVTSLTSLWSSQKTQNELNDKADDAEVVKLTGDQTVNGVKTWTDNGVFQGNLEYGTTNSSFIDEGNLGTVHTFDFNAASNYRGILNDDITITISNLDNGQVGSLILDHDDVAQRTLSWTGVDTWLDGEPVDGPVAGEKFFFTFLNDGTQVVGFVNADGVVQDLTIVSVGDADGIVPSGAKKSVRMGFGSRTDERNCILPTATDFPEDKFLYIKDEAGQAGTHKIVVQADLDDDGIDGAGSSVDINTDYGGMTLYRTGNKWHIL